MQIETILKTKIRMGELKEGDRLPPEPELSKQFGVSPLTVRQALASLVEEGYLDRKPGRGTLIRKGPGERVILNLSGDMDELLSLSKETDTKLLRFESIPGHDKASSFLKLNRKEPLYFVEKVRYWRRIPFMVVEEFVPQSLTEEIPANKKSFQSLYSFLTRRKGFVLKEAIQTIESSTADQRLASLLQIEMGAPLFYMERVFHGDPGFPILFQIASTRADHFKFSVRFEHVEKDKKTEWAAY